MGGGVVKLLWRAWTQFWRLLVETALLKSIVEMTTTTIKKTTMKKTITTKTTTTKTTKIGIKATVSAGLVFWSYYICPVQNGIQMPLTASG